MDGKESSGVNDAVQNVLDHAADQWATAEYRTQAGLALAKRSLEAVS
jgi:hypothetical protein